jgi:hypothetical protein
VQFHLLELTGLLVGLIFKTKTIDKLSYHLKMVAQFFLELKK